MKRLTLLTLLMLFLSPPSYALKCSNRIVDVGDRVDKVQNRCGEPEASNSYKKNVAVAYLDPRTNLTYFQNVEVLVDEWTYNFGPMHFKQLLRFENSVLKEIQNLERGD